MPFRLRMSKRLPLRLEKLHREEHEPLELVEALVVNQAFPVRLIAKVRVPIARDLDEANDLVVAEADNWIVHSPLVETQPVVMRLSIWPDTKPIPVDADACPLAKPRSHLGTRAEL